MSSLTCDQFKDVAIFVLGTLDELCRMGLVRRGDNADSLTPEGIARFAELKEMDFAPSDDSIRAVMEIYRAPDKGEVLYQQAPNLLQACKNAIVSLSIMALPRRDTIVADNATILKTVSQSLTEAVAKAEGNS